MERIQYLWQQFIAKKASDAEVDELLKHIASDEGREQHLAYLEELAEKTEEMPGYDRQSWQYLVDAALHSSKKRARILEMEDTAAKPAHHINFQYYRWLGYVAVFLLFFGAVKYIWISNKDKKVKEVAVRTIPGQSDVSPGMSGAVLTLADGTTVVLDSMGNGVIANQNGTKVVMKDGMVLYDAKDAAQVSYNTISTPNGRQFQLVLPDGSKVWLNAASSIRYPTAFTGKERKVEVTGETYFEVARYSGMVFKVSINRETEIEVLGTSFNINAYSEESSINTTLLEGSLKINTKNQTKMLTPRQQLQVYKTGELNLTKNSDLQQVIAWKNGVFNFQDMKLEEVMRQISRWYNVEIVYGKNIPAIEFFGEMGRDLQLSQVLKGLEGMGLTFEIKNGNRLLVMPD